MTDDKAQRPSIDEHRGEGGKHPIVRLGQGSLDRSFKFDTDRKIIAALTALKARLPGVPGAIITRHKLNQLAATADQKVRRHPQAGERLEPGMQCRVEAVGKEALNRIAAEAAGRQADMVDHEQFNHGRSGSPINEAGVSR